MSNGTTITQKNNNKKHGWNLNCDMETHEALDLLGAWMVGKEKMHKDLKDSVKIPKTKVIKILALEKLSSLKLLNSTKKTTNEVATI